MPRKKMTEAEKKAFAAKMKAARAAKAAGKKPKKAAKKTAKKSAKKRARKPKFLAETMANLGSSSSSPRQKKSRTKKARKSAKSQKKRAGTTLAATLKALGVKTPKKRKRKAPKKSAAKKSAPKRAKKSAPKRAIRKVSGFVFPHASGSERKCVKCGRLHSLREHWSHKYMHATPRTKHSYLCKRGGFCAFENLSKRDLAQALKIESERSKSKKRQAELALKYYKLMGKVR